MANYFNSLPHRLKVQELGKCDFMQSSEFADGVTKLIGKKIPVLENELYPLIDHNPIKAPKQQHQRRPQQQEKKPASGNKETTPGKKKSKWRSKPRTPNK